MLHLLCVRPDRLRATPRPAARIASGSQNLRNERAQARIIAKLRQVRAGNLGDCKSVGDGVIELRIDSRARLPSVLRSLRSRTGRFALRRRQIDPIARHQTRKRILGRLEAEAVMKTYKAGIPYEEWEIKQLRSNPELGTECLKLALESLDNPDERAGSLLMLRAFGRGLRRSRRSRRQSWHQPRVSLPLAFAQGQSHAQDTGRGAQHHGLCAFPSSPNQKSAQTNSEAPGKNWACPRSRRMK